MPRRPRGTPPSPEPAGLGPRLREVHLDLLPVLHELLRTRSVTRAARSLGLSQPAVSQILRRLRETFGDDLLVSLGRRLEPTDRGEAIIRPLASALEEIEGLLRPPTEFDPARESAHVIIATADYVSLLLAPVMAQFCATEAPGIVFEFVDATIRSADDLRKIDLLLAPLAFGNTLGKRIGRLLLWKDDIVCIVAADNRAITGRLTPDAYRHLRQAVYRPNTRMTEKTRALLQPTSVLESSQVISVPDFVVLGAIVEQTDCVALVPRKLAKYLVQNRALRIVELTYSRNRFAIGAYWSPILEGKRSHLWTRELVKRAASEIA